MANGHSDVAAFFLADEHQEQGFVIAGSEVWIDGQRRLFYLTGFPSIGAFRAPRWPVPLASLQSHAQIVLAQPIRAIASNCRVCAGDCSSLFSGLLKNRRCRPRGGGNGIRLVATGSSTRVSMA